MKFISKNANLRVVLSPGIPGERLTGRLLTPGKYVKFEMGVAVVNDPEWIRMMKEHPGFNSDFIAVEEGSTEDPYALSRKEVEPEHDNISIEYGHVGKNLNPKGHIPMSNEQKQVINKIAAEMAKEMIKDLVPKMAKDLLKQMVEKNQSIDKTKVKKSPGRPKRNNIEDIKDDIKEDIKTETVSSDVESASV